MVSAGAATPMVAPARRPCGAPTEPALTQPNPDAPPAPSQLEARLTLPEAVAFALEQHKQRRLPEARQIYEAVLSQEPDHPDALHFLGLLLQQTGEIERGLALVERAVELSPGYTDALNNLGNLYKLLGRLDEAEVAYQRVRALDPNAADAYNNLAILAKARGRLDEALELLERACELAPDHAEAHFNRGSLLERMRRYEEAIAAYDRAIDAAPRHRYGIRGPSYRELGRLFYVMGRADQAEKVFRRWISVEPESEAARHMLAACTQRDVPRRAANGFVREVFDSFAESFDEVLDKLSYRAPSLVASALEQQGVASEGCLDVLDAGCGTGLCGPLLRPWARELTGVDLSPPMLLRARGRNVYDRLEEAELTGFLAAQRSRFDVIASADTLCYFGALDDFSRAAAGALRPGGRLIFTIEHAVGEQEPEMGYRLELHGRYAHTEDYVRRTLEAAGLDVASIAYEELRDELAKPVKGLVVVARKPLAAAA